jgi:hypothetical protein
MTNRTQIIEHKGTAIFFIDFSKLKTFEEIHSITVEAQKYIHAQPHNSIYTLTSVEDTHFNTEIRNMFTEYVKSNKSYVKRSAVVGVTGLKLILFNTMMKLTGRDTRSFSGIEEAKDWLTNN